ncbi:MAG: hypothetical protein Q9209_005983 [Squamulea sp. 1 TL-2023]
MRSKFIQYTLNYRIRSDPESQICITMGVKNRVPLVEGETRAKEESMDSDLLPMDLGDEYYKVVSYKLHAEFSTSGIGSMQIKDEVESLQGSEPSVPTQETITSAHQEPEEAAAPLSGILQLQQATKLANLLFDTCRFVGPKADMHALLHALRGRYQRHDNPDFVHAGLYKDTAFWRLTKSLAEYTGTCTYPYRLASQSPQSIRALHDPCFIWRSI